MQQIVWCLFSAVLLVTISASISAQDTGKKFLKKPLVIEDQGSFFIGGVPKVTNYATLPPPNAPPTPRPTKSPSGRCTCSFRYRPTRSRRRRR